MKQGIWLRNAWALALALVLASLIVGGAFATPSPNSAVLNLRIFDDCPFSNLQTTNSYPASVSFSDYDGAFTCNGFANLHNWRLSEDGSTPAGFNNGDEFFLGLDMVLNGNGEAGIQIAPWWSPNVDGRFNVRSTDGEIACFGGRLPFYTFTGVYGLHYAQGTSIHLEVIYVPHSLSAADPATITYRLTYNGTTYSSGPLKFDSGNISEGPLHGLWGILNDAQVGAHLQVLESQGTGADVTFSNIQFIQLPLAVSVDFKPGTCDNPLPAAGNGVVAAAILGSADVDVNTIDLTSVKLQGVAGKKGAIADLDGTGNSCGACVPAAADGYADLTMKFSNAGVIQALAPLTSEDVELHLTGAYTDGKTFAGSDCATIKGNFDGNTHISLGFRTLSAPNAPVQIIQYAVPAPAQVRIAVYSVTGRLVKELVQGVQPEGVHSVSWDVSKAPSGMYFYRFETADHQETMKSVIVH